MTRPLSARLTLRNLTRSCVLLSALVTHTTHASAQEVPPQAPSAPASPQAAQADPQASPQAQPAAEVTAPAPTQPARSAEERALIARVVDGVQGFYAEAKDFHADFTQTFTYKIYQRKKVSTGKVFFKKPALMRWDYEAPHQRLFIADGATLWVYEPEEGQVFKRDLASAQLPVALRFMKGEGKLTDDFNINTFSSKEGSYELSLTPKSPSSEYRSLTLIVDPERFQVKASVLIDPVGNSNHIAFADAHINSALPDEGFKYSPPEGVRVIGD